MFSGDFLLPGLSGDLGDEDEIAVLSDLGVGESGLDRLIHAAYKILNL